MSNFDQLNLHPKSYCIYQEMEEYLYEYQENYQPQIEANNQLQHYRLEIDRLKNQIKDEALTYQKRIAKLQEELLRANKKPTVVAPVDKRSTNKQQENLSYELYEKDLQIRQLKAENVKLRQIINNPDKVLIRKPDHFEIITEKEQEIIKLRKTIQDLEGKHDGQFLSQQRLKKQNDMLQHELEKLRVEIRYCTKYSGINQQRIDPQLLEALRYKKQLEATQKQVKVLQNALKEKEGQLLVWKNKYANSRNIGLGVGTQYEEFKMELNQYRQKNKELNKVVLKLQEENEKLHQERDRARFAADQRLPDVAKKVQNESERAQNLMRYHQSRSMAMKSLVPPAQEDKVPITMRKTTRYDQFHFSDWQSVV